MAHQDKTGLERLLEILIFGFLVICIIVRPYISEMKADVSGPTSLLFAQQSYDNDKSMNFFVNVLMGFTALAFVLLLILRERLQSYRSGIDYFLIAFVGLASLSVFWSAHHYSSIIYALTWMSIAFLFFVTVNLSAAQLGRYILYGVVTVGVVLAVNGLVEVFYIYPQLQEEVASGKFKFNASAYVKKALLSRIQAGEAAGPFASPNILGGFLAILIPLITGMIADCFDRENLPKVRAAALCVALLLVGGCLFFTGSKGAWMGLVVGMTVFVIISFRQTLLSSWKKGLITGVAVVAVFAGIIGAAYGIAGKVPGEKSINVRLQYWKATQDMIGDHSWGVGLNQFHNYYPQYKLVEAEEMVYSTHNDYLQVWAELGLLGLILYLLIWGFFYYRAGRDLSVSHVFVRPSKKKDKKSKKSDQVPSTMSDDVFFATGKKHALLLCFAGVMGFVFLIFIGAVSTDRELLLPMMASWIVFSLVLAYPREKDAPSEVSFRKAPADLYFTRIGILAGVAVFLFHSFGSFLLYSSGVFFLVILLVAVALGHHHVLVKEKTKDRYLVDYPLTVSTQLGVFFCFVSIVGVSVYLLQMTVYADSHIRRGDTLRRKSITATKIDPKEAAKNVSDSPQKISETQARLRVKVLKKAREEYLAALDLVPFDEKVAMGVAKVSEFIYQYAPTEEHFAETVGFYKLAMSIAPRNHNIPIQLARFYDAHPQYDTRRKKAIEYFEKAAKLFPTNPRLHYVLGQTYLKKARENKGDRSKNFRWARESFTEAQRLNVFAPKPFSMDSQTIDKARRRAMTEEFQYIQGEKKELKEKNEKRKKTSK